MTLKTSTHYVDNTKFYAALREYRAACAAAEQRGEERPGVPEYVGECFLRIAQHLSYKPNFMNYTYRDDMISDGVENCLVYVSNFDPDKSTNPFGYFTQIIYFAFIRRIQREKKHSYIRCKMIEQTQINGGAFSPAANGKNPQADNTYLNFDNVQEFITRYDDMTRTRRERRRAAKLQREVTE